MTGPYWLWRGERLDLAKRPLIMGIINVTPDSFYAGSRRPAAAAAVPAAEAMRAEGADVIDVGGESTRPGAEPVDPEEEKRRVLPVIEALSGRGIPVSIDTRHPQVAAAALQAGASIVNDISGLADPELARVAARAGAALVIMHLQGEPRTMQNAPRYRDVVAEVRQFLADRLALAEQLGVPREAICVDVGIGFGKRPDDNLALLRHLAEFSVLRRPLLVGLSRKSFLGAIGAGDTPEERLAGSLVAAAWAFREGARVFRVHDVLETRRALACEQALEAAA